MVQEALQRTFFARAVQEGRLQLLKAAIFSKTPSKAKSAAITSTRTTAMGSLGLSKAAAKVSSSSASASGSKDALKQLQSDLAALLASNDEAPARHRVEIKNKGPGSLTKAQVQDLAEALDLEYEEDGEEEGVVWVCKGEW